MSQKLPMWVQERLDGRFAGNSAFRYRIRTAAFHVAADRARAYVDMLSWMWQTFGPAADRETILTYYHDDLTVRWAWYDGNVNVLTTYIYLRDDADLALWKLRWT